MKSKIVTLDIETAPVQAYVWGLWDQNVGLDMIKEDFTILSFGAKWLDSKELIYFDTSGKGPNKVRDDKALCGKLWDLLNGAEIVVAQNGASFDLKKINARMATHGMSPYSPVRVVDTLRSAKKHFAFTSNKLAHLSATLTPDTTKSIHKKYPGFTLWLECLKDNPDAWKEMKKYNLQDVKATEQLYLKLRPWITNHPNLSMYSNGVTCPKCNEGPLQSRGVSVTQSGMYQRYCCQKCGGWSRGKQNMIEAADRKEKVA